MTTTIVFLAPDPDSAERAYRVSRELGIDVGIRVCAGQDKIDAAVQAVRDGAEVLISRWGFSYKEMAAKLNVPLIPTKITAIDMTRALVKAKAMSSKICVISSQPVVRCACEMAGYLNIPIVMTRVLTSLAPLEIDQALREASESGAEVVVGGVTITSAAPKFGLQGMQIQIGEEVIADALNEAARIIPVKRWERAKAEEIRTIIDFINDGVIAVDQDGIITVFNKMSERLTGVRVQRAMGAPVDAIIPELGLTRLLNSREAEIGRLQQIRGRQVVTNRVPVMIDGRPMGAVVTIAELSSIQNVEQKVRKELYAKGLVARVTFNDMVGKSREFKKAIELAHRFAVTEEAILISGETGTGKEMFAQSIHNSSPRKDGPFVAINCAAIPETLLESELFGYTEGAFTGARKHGKPGLFELAHRGTIFLDEVGETPASVQARLLRVLQEREVMRLGDDKVIPVDVRVIAATNVDLRALVAQGTFRADLYYRLNVLSLRLPPLRERREDIMELFRCFAAELEAKTGRRLGRLDRGAVRKLLRYGWPGNVRELRNVVCRLFAVCDEGCEITYEHVEQAIGAGAAEGARQSVLRISEAEANLIWQALEQAGGNKAKAASLLGISYSTLWRRLKRIEKESAIAD